MEGITTHSGALCPRNACEIQLKLSKRLILEPLSKRVTTVAGVDVRIRGRMATAAVVVLTYPDLEKSAQAVAKRPVAFPYIPGLLSFREGPVVLDAVAKLDTLPDVMIFDGQGIAHPRRLGIASHIGILLDLPTIGCAKSRLCGEYAQPHRERGHHTLLTEGGDAIGAVVRTRTCTRPVFVSPGHRIDISGSIEYVLGCCTRYRLPETTRLAHHLASTADA